DSSGLLPLGNDGNGVWVFESSGNSILENDVSYNLGNGVQIEGSYAIENTISLNSIHDNAYEGIVNLSEGNLELAPPVITSMLGDHIEGTAPPDSWIEIFADTAGEGGTYLGEAVADPEGTFEYYSPLAGPNLTATATDGSGNTSEFSQPVFWAPDTCEFNESFEDACDVAEKLDFSLPSAGSFTSYISRPGDLDWFYFDLPESVTPGDQITISLSGLDETALPANYDLVVLAELTVDPATNATPLQGVPLQGVPLQGVPLQGVPLQGVPLQGVPLQGVPLQGVETESIPLQGVPLQGVPLQGVPLQGVPLQGVPLQGVPLQGVPLQGVGFHQGKSPEVVSTLYRGSMSGRFYVLVWSSTGEFGITPEASKYEVKVVTHPVVVDACTTGIDQNLLGDPYEGPETEPVEPRTLILVHRPRMVALYGPEETNNLVETLEGGLLDHRLVDGVIVDLGDPSFYVGEVAAQALEDAYFEWDQHGCQSETANLVTLEIKKTILQILDEHENIENIVIVGGDKIIPHRRVPDGVVRTEEIVPNEFDYQLQSAEDGYKMGNISVRNNPLHATLRLQYYLSDDFYADLAPILLPQGYELSVPDMPIGRLVEAPEDIV
ncbi:MAG: right-handed parallel beta-helix repeat-containing protein, partial [Anaerolineales bacterium]|nr:right-handed parallel beta-helix repeat-containing protein [Anaerolineales bacterium]